MMKTPRGLHVCETDIRPPWRTKATAPVVFHHGVGTNLGIWSEWIPSVASLRRTVRFDMRGFGQSSKPPTDHTWRLQEMIDDLMEVVDAAGPHEKVHLVGESIGGTIVLAAAIAHPARIASVTICNAAYRGPGINRVGGWRNEIAERGIGAWADQMMELRFAAAILSPAKSRWFAEAQRSSLAHAVLGLGEMLAAVDLTSQLNRMAAPLLILMPDQSPFVPVTQGHELQAAVPGARLRVFDGVRHGLPFSHGLECARELVAFLETIDPADDSASASS